MKFIVVRVRMRGSWAELSRTWTVFSSLTFVSRLISSSVIRFDNSSSMKGNKEEGSGRREKLEIDQAAVKDLGCDGTCLCVRKSCFLHNGIVSLCFDRDQFVMQFPTSRRFDLIRWGMMYVIINIVYND